MTTIYIRHANGQIMEVQNWDTLTDYGAMVMRPLSASEQERYLALKAIRFKDLDIWQVLHPKVLDNTSSSASSVSGCPVKPEKGRSDRPKFRSSQPQSSQFQSSQSQFSSVERKPQESGTVRKNPVSRYSAQLSRSQQGYAPPTSRTNPDIEISTRELSKNALLHIIQKACGRDIEVLKGASRDDLLSLASGILPPAGVPVKVMPQLN